MSLNKYSLRKNTGERIPELDQKYGTLIADILIARDIDSLEKANIYLHANLKDIHGDPFSIPDMTKSIERIHHAIQKNEHITIHADYDCDGIPGACVLSNLFNIINYKNYTVSLPDRNQEGYGLGIEHVQKISDQGSSLIITIDLGITAIESVNYANEKNIDVIITDHHTMPEVLPNAYGIIHPKVNGSVYPNQELCGAGVIYTLVRAFESVYKETYNIPNNFSYSLIDYVGFATLSDMVTLTPENKSFIKEGLDIIRNKPRTGFMALAIASRVYLKDLDQGDIAFMLAPKLNVASRMGNPYDAYNLLMEKDQTKAKVLADKLVALSNERRKLVALMVKEAKREIARTERDKDDVITIGHPSWRVGLLGLVASKIVETYDKPAFVWGRTEGKDEQKYKGSCRGNSTISVHSLLSHVSPDILSEYGGHFEAGGFGVNEDKIHDLHNEMNKAFIKMQKDKLDEPEKKVMIDTILPISLLKPGLHSAVNKIGPFGPGNLEPVFGFTNVEIMDIRNFGTGNAHIEITFRDKNGLTASTYAFYKNGADVGNPQIGDTAHIVGTLDTKLWQGNVRIKLKDVVASKSTIL
jgi:single-stranded-DNA-specific exonuclease